MKFYHRTTEENWKHIQNEKVLWGKSKNTNRRFTYISSYDEWGESYGPILLEVEYEIEYVNPNEEYEQVVVFEPIDISEVRRIL